MIHRHELFLATLERKKMRKLLSKCKNYGIECLEKPLQFADNSGENCMIGYTSNNNTYVFSYNDTPLFFYNDVCKNGEQMTLWTFWLKYIDTIDDLRDKFDNIEIIDRTYKRLSDVIYEKNIVMYDPTKQYLLEDQGDITEKGQTIAMVHPIDDALMPYGDKNCVPLWAVMNNLNELIALFDISKDYQLMDILREVLSYEYNRYTTV